MNSRSLALLATVGSLLALSPPSRAQADDGQFPAPSAVQAANRNAKRQEAMRYLVRFKTSRVDLAPLQLAIRAARSAQPGPAALAAVDRTVQALQKKARSSRGAFTQFVEAEKGKVEEYFWLIPAASVVLPRGAEKDLLRHPEVASLERDLPRGPAFIKTSTNAKNLGTDAVQAAGVTGKGLTLAIVDSGIDMLTSTLKRPHACFYVNGDPTNKTGGGILGSRVLANYKLGAQAAEDAISHGTAVASVAVGAKWNKRSASDHGHAMDAQIVSYAIADLPNGLALISTLVKAWQKVSADAAKHKIKVVNLSYWGAPLPTVSDEAAMDKAVQVADLVVAVSGGNDGSVLTRAHGATNVLSVGAVSHDKHQVSAFSNRGRIPAGMRRYPSLVANGVDMVMAQMDNESTERKSSGTSYSAPAVAGGAHLYRTLRPAANSLETRAAILVTTEDITAQNLLGGFGYGYLRIDRLVDLAKNKLSSMMIQNKLSNTTKTRKYRYAVQKGKWYGAALTWNRLDVTKLTWSRMKLEAWNGSTLLARSDQSGELSQKIVFQAPFTGAVDIVATAVTLEAASVDFGLAAAESMPPYLQPSASYFGTSCKTAAKFDPLLSYSGHFAPGHSYKLFGTQLEAVAPTGFTIGFSNKNFGPLPLPLPLKTLGAPGCWLLTSHDHVAAVLSSQFGIAEVTIVVPSIRALVGMHLYHQVLAVSPKANKLGMAFSRGVDIGLGGQR